MSEHTRPHAETRSACPQPERLAEYAEGVLDDAGRREIERHLVDCPDCRAVLSETMAFLAAEPAEDTGRAPGRVVPFRARRWVVGAASGLAAAAALVLVIRVARPSLFDGWFGPRSDRPELQELVAALANEPTRPVEGRLTGGFKYAPPPSPTRGPGDREVSPDVRIAAAKIEKLARDGDPHMLAASAVAYLALNDVDRAVKALEEATSQQPTSREFQSDLSAAYLARADRLSRPDDLPKALAAAERALGGDRRLPEALFNRALALEALHLRDQAVNAWVEFQQVDAAGNAEWQAEAARHLAELRRGAGVTRWPDSLARVRTTRLTADDARALTAQFPQQIREFVLEDALPAWARESAAGNSERASDLRATARLLAHALAERTGERLLASCVAAIDEQPMMNDAVIGYLAYGRGNDAYRQFRPRDAHRSFIEARQALRSAANPCASWASLNVAVMTFYARDLAGAETQLIALRREVNAAESAAFVARTAWMLGLIHVDQGKYDRSFDDYLEASRLYSSIGERANVASIESLLAENSRVLGDSSLTWQHQLRALSDIDQLTRARNRQGILMTAGLAASSDDLPEASLSFYRAAADISAVENDPSADAQIRVRIAEVLQVLNRSSEAIVEAGRARKSLDVVTDASIHGRLQSELLRVDAQIRSRKAPHEAVILVSDALKYVESAAMQENLPVLYLTRARLFRAMGKLDEAERDLEAAIQVFEAHVQSASQHALRVSYFDEAWAAFDELISLKAIDRAAPWQALTIAERGRRRGHNITDRWFENIPSEVATVYYSVLDDRILIWVLHQGQIRFAIRQLTAQSLSRLSHQAMDLLSRPGAAGDQRLRDLLTTLYRELVEPIESYLDAGVSISIIPDGPLHALPFACLVSPRTRRYWVEEHSITVSPSGALLAASAARYRPLASDLPVLVENQADPGDPARFPRLRNIEDEAKVIASVYSNAEVMSRTPDDFRDALRHYSVVHFGGHALSNEEYPDLSRLVFRGQDGRPSFLFAKQIDAAEVGRAALVVLAACRSAAGRLSRGEGPLSLARPFLDAGVPAVIASEWEVEDETAAAFFRAFYLALARHGESARAFHEAQLDLLRGVNRRMTDPRQWGAFIYAGASRPFVRRKS